MPPTARPRCNARLLRRQSGQILPIGVAGLILALALTLFLFNAGQVTAEKMRLINTADAVAYSAGVFQARVLNYDAITNRAMIANQVAIGQAVSLAAWDRYVQPISENIPGFTGVTPVDVALQGLRSWSATVASGAAMVEPLTALAVEFHAEAMRTLSESQARMHGLNNVALLRERLELMREIARLNDPAASVDSLPLEDNFGQLAVRLTRREDRTRMADLVRASGDAFIEGRSWKPLPAHLPRLAGCEIGPRLIKRGGGALIDVDGWKAMDTLSLHLYGVRVRAFRLRCTHSEMPIGYGSARTRSRLSDPSVDYGGSRALNPSASRRAEGNDSEYLPTPGSSAIPSFYELDPVWWKGERSGEDPRVTLAIRVSKPSGALRYSGGRSEIRPAGRLALFKGDPGAYEMTAVGRVEVFFDRTLGVHPSGRRERPSLFSPYWQVRLQVDESDRGRAGARQGAPWWS